MISNLMYNNRFDLWNSGLEEMPQSNDALKNAVDGMWYFISVPVWVFFCFLWVKRRKGYFYQKFQVIWIDSSDMTVRKDFSLLSLVKWYVVFVWFHLTFSTTSRVGRTILTILVCWQSGHLVTSHNTPDPPTDMLPHTDLPTSLLA